MVTIEANLKARRDSGERRPTNELNAVSGAKRHNQTDKEALATIIAALAAVGRAWRTLEATSIDETLPFPRRLPSKQPRLRKHGGVMIRPVSYTHLTLPTILLV